VQDLTKQVSEFHTKKIVLLAALNSRNRNSRAALFIWKTALPAVDLPAQNDKPRRTIFGRK
jgi:hypothetical protein